MTNPNVIRYANSLISEIQRQTNVFDAAICAIEQVTNDAMTSISDTMYQSDPWNGLVIQAALNENLYGGTVLVNIMNTGEQPTRLATSAIDTSNNITESLFNVDNVSQRTNILSILTEVFTAVKSLETAGGENDENSGEVEST